MPDLSIVIVSYRAASYLERCLDTLAHAGHRGLSEVLVVDNASGDDTVARVRARHPWATLLPLPVNLGFSAANNIGAERARGRRIVFLNPDTEVPAGALETLGAALDADPRAAIAAPRLDNPDESLQVSCYAFPSLAGHVLDGTPLPWIRPFGRYGAHRFCDPSSARTREVDWACGACLMIDAGTFHALGGFDERFFMYSEDVDLCRRVHEAGRRVIYVPASRVVHHGNRSEGEMSPAVFARAGRSRLLLERAMHPARSPRWLWLALRLGAAAGAVSGAVAAVLRPPLAGRIRAKVRWLHGLARGVRDAWRGGPGPTPRRHPLLRVKAWLRGQSRVARAVDAAARRLASLAIAGVERVAALGPRPSLEEARPGIRRVVFTSFYGIGDGLMDLPVWGAVRRAFPAARVTAVCSRAHAELLRHQPEVDEIVAIDESEFFAAARRLRAEGVDLYVSVQASLEYALFGRLCGARLRAGYLWDYRAARLAGARAPAVVNRDRSRVARGRWIGDLLGAEAPAQPSLRLVEADLAGADRVLAAAGLAPGARFLALNANKTASWLGAGRWPAARWRAIVRTLRRDHAVPVVLLGSEAERADVAALAAAFFDDDGVIDMAGAASLRTTAAILARAALLVTTDSGLMHLAGAVGTPAVSIFTFSDVESFASGALNRALVRPVPCSPCVRNGFDARDNYPPICRHDYRCGRALPAADVEAAIREALARASPAASVRA